MTAGPLINDGLIMIATLLLIVGGLLFLNHCVRRRLPPGGRGAGARRIRILENAHLGVKKSIALVRVPGAVLVVGLTADRITLLERIDDGDGAFTEGATSADPPDGRRFKRHLQRLASTVSGGGTP